ncbi:MAG: protein translocase subunit SecF [Chromatiales bacterium]|jgi:preprotein translocase subunit SecF|nr:protein translocase subunit SecF [Chromatiales bacterium]
MSKARSVAKASALGNQINFMGQRRITTTLSIVLILVSLVSLGTRGLNFGIDFTGGVLLEAEYPQAADLGSIRADLASNDFAAAQVQNFGNVRDVLIRVLPLEGVNNGQLGEQILSILQSSEPAVALRRIEFVGPQVGEELTEQGGLAMIFALLLILAYIMFRFQWKFAVGSVTALVHDVVITLGVFSVLQISFDLSVLAAVLAVIGYSLNDTIVVFDRIRENFREIHQGNAEELMNGSVNQMLSRTVITSLTTLLVLMALLFLGGEAVNGFAIALIVGVIVGTYSSVFTASASALFLNVSPQDLLPPEKDPELDELP